MTQPAQLDSYGRTLIELNSISPFIPPIVMGPRRAVILYSDASATQDVSYLCIQLATYEAAYHLSMGGGHVGFLVDSSLATPAGCNAFIAHAQAIHMVLLVPSTSYVSEAAFSCLQTYWNAMGNNSVVRIAYDALTPTLLYDERGNARPAQQMQWVMDTPIVPARAAIDLLPLLEAMVLRGGWADRAVQCVDAATGSTAFGVMCRYSTCSTGKPLLDGVLMPATAASLPPCSYTVFIISYRQTSSNLTLLTEAGPVSKAYFLLTNTTMSIASGLVLDGMELAVVMI
jgi:hypothetical protein